MQWLIALRAVMGVGMGAEYVMDMVSSPNLYLLSSAAGTSVGSRSSQVSAYSPLR